MTSMASRSIPLVLVLLIAACRGGTSASSLDGGAGDAVAAPRFASCDRSATMGLCSEYEGEYLAHNEALLTGSCARLGGTFVAAECPNTSIVGACRLRTSEHRKFYGTGSAAYAPERARMECEAVLRGMWQPR
jgi:hypothetical protein